MTKIEQPDACDMCGNDHAGLKELPVAGASMLRWLCEWCELISDDSLKVTVSRMFQKLAASFQLDKEMMYRADKIRERLYPLVPGPDDQSYSVAGLGERGIIPQPPEPKRIDGAQPVGVWIDEIDAWANLDSDPVGDEITALRAMEDQQGTGPYPNLMNAPDSLRDRLAEITSAEPDTGPLAGPLSSAFEDLPAPTERPGRRRPAFFDDVEISDEDRKAVAAVLDSRAPSVSDGLDDPITDYDSGL